MSFYATVQGHIAYESNENFEKACAYLKERSFLDDEGYLLDECGDRLTDPYDDGPTVSGNEICIPLYHYRNLSWTIDKLFRFGGKGKVVFTSTDDCFDGYVVTENGETIYDLSKWAMENVEETEPDQNEDPGGWLEWSGEVESAFFCEHY